MAHLYVNSQGEPWYKHSYSAGNDFDQSPYKYYLRRVLGWREADNKARFLFGKALEESIQAHHNNGGKGAVEDFKVRWALHKDTPDINYTNVEKDWDTCLQMGVDMIRLYVAVQPTLPIPLGGKTVFQREYAKEVFPDDPMYGGIEDAGKLDIVCYVDPHHPKLPSVDWKPEQGDLRPLIVDIKTSAVDFPEQPGLAGYDAQLRRYSWQSGIEDVALLWFRKRGLGLKRGYQVTLIDPCEELKPGDEVYVAEVNKDTDEVVVVPQEFMLESASDTLACGVSVPRTSVTRQRLQFNAGRVSQASADDAGEIAARQIVSIVNACNRNKWPNTFGIRFPKDDRSDPYFRAFVLKDEEFRKKNFTNKNAEADFDSAVADEPD